ncbi:MAG: translation elongation factor 4 [Actinobacteria bacterium]|nr:translation elongation factor 4 [Actinomycetota bacterium]
MQHIRNFSIIAHIDHGKSTLADRLLQLTKVVDERKFVEQYLDRMDIERERGITIKAQTVRMPYEYEGQTYILNLIDTPGHVDFTYEVSRSLAACEGALLVVDATQGVEAQTIANALLALENNLVIIPVINKIDLPAANVERTKKEIEESLAIPADEAILISAKTGENVEEVLKAIIEKVPPPSGKPDGRLRALIFDSWYDAYRGVGLLIKVVDGIIKRGDQIKLMASQKVFEVEEVGYMSPDPVQAENIMCGEVGYIFAGIKDPRDTRIGDTITKFKEEAETPLPGYKEPKPVVFTGIFPVEGGEFEKLRDSLEKLRLNDPSVFFEPETSKALGFGFRCGFLGLLHMEIIKERLEREFGLELIATAPSVAYKVVKTNGEIITIKSPAEMPNPNLIEKIEEPYVRAVIMTNAEYVGDVMELCQEKRGILRSMNYLSENRVEFVYELPLAEIIFDFFDRLKSKTKGYASFDYELIGHRESDLVKLDILINGEPVDALSMIVHRDKAYRRGRELVSKLKELIPRQLFDVPVQAAVGSRVIARETIKALRKDVLAKCYGGDVTRKRKLLEKQKEGKKRLKALGKVQVPQETFIEILKVKEG